LGVVPEKNIWPGWVRYTATAAFSFGAAVVTVTLVAADIRNTADHAKAGVADHESRIRALESTSADLRAMKEAMAEMRADIKTLLARPK